MEQEAYRRSASENGKDNLNEHMRETPWVEHKFKNNIQALSQGPVIALLA